MAIGIFAKIGDIKGESSDARHKDEIEVLSWASGVSQTGSVTHGGGGGAGKATFQDFSFTHNIDRASPLLMKSCASGAHIPEATITVRKAGKGQQEYLIITMTRCSDHRRGPGRCQRRAQRRRECDPSNGQGRPRVQSPEARRIAEPGLHFKYDIKANKVG